MRTFLLAIFSIVFLMIIFAAPVSSDTANEYTTIVITESKTYSINDSASIMIHFYERDVLVDANDINVTIENTSGSRYIEVNEAASRQEVGIYGLSFQIMEEDDRYGDGVVKGEVRCSKSDSRGEKYDTVPFSIFLNYSIMEVIVRADKPYFSAGEMVRFDVAFSVDGNAMDPETIRTTLVVNAQSQDIELVMRDTGDYYYEYSSPEDSIGREVILIAEGDQGNIQGRNEAAAFVNNAQVWFHLDMLTPEGLSGQIGVCDNDGNPQEVDISLIYGYLDNLDKPLEKWISGVTGLDGLLDVDLNFSDIKPGEEEIELMVWANNTGSRSDEYHQFARETVRIRNPDSPQGNDFEVVFQENVNLSNMIPATTYSLEYIAYQNGEHLGNKEVFYYYFSSSWLDPEATLLSDGMGEVYIVGSTTTDESGRFTVEFTTPDYPVKVLPMFKIDTSESRYGSGEWEVILGEGILIRDIFSIDHETEIEITNFGVGQKVTVSVSKQGVVGGKGGIRVFPVDPSAKDEELIGKLASLNISGWKQSNILQPEFEDTFVGDTFTREIAIPNLFPQDSYFTIVGFILDNITYDHNGSFANYVVIDREGNLINLSEERINITSNIPYSMDADDMTSIEIHILDEVLEPLEGVFVTLETTGPIHTCKSSTTTDVTGIINCLIESDNFTGADRNATIWINATKDGYTSEIYVKEMIIHAWRPSLDMEITTNLPDVLGSMDSSTLLISVTHDGEPVPDVDVTIQASGSASTCKQKGTTNENGKISCAVYANHVMGEDSSVTIYLNGTKKGYKRESYVKFIVIKAWDAPDEFINPIEAEIGGSVTVRVMASIVGDVLLNMTTAEQPDSDDPKSIGAYVDITSSGSGSIRWINITMTYEELPQGITPEKLRIFYWDTFYDRWLLAKSADVDPENKILWANVTHLTIFAPREVDDIIPPTIEHKPVTSVKPNDDLVIKATITDEGNGVTKVTLFYRNKGDTIYKIVNMDQDGDSYSYVIPANEIKDVGIEYYIRASDGWNTKANPEDTSQPHEVKIGDEEDDNDDGFIPGYETPILISTIILLGILAWKKRT